MQSLNDFDDVFSNIADVGIICHAFNMHIDIQGAGGI